MNCKLHMLRKLGSFSTTLARKLVCFLAYAFLWHSAILQGLYYISLQHFHFFRGQSPSCSCRHLIFGDTQWPPSSWQLWKLDVASEMKRVEVKTGNIITPPSESLVHAYTESIVKFWFMVLRSKDIKNYGVTRLFYKRRNLWHITLKRKLREGYHKEDGCTRTNHFNCGTG